MERGRHNWRFPLAFTFLNKVNFSRSAFRRIKFQVQFAKKRESSTKLPLKKSKYIIASTDQRKKLNLLEQVLALEYCANRFQFPCISPPDPGSVKFTTKPILSTKKMIEKAIKLQCTQICHNYLFLKGSSNKKFKSTKTN